MNKMCHICHQDLKGNTAHCPYCGEPVLPPVGVIPPSVPTPGDPLGMFRFAPIDVTLLEKIFADLEPLRSGSYTDGIKQLALRLKDENTQLRKENAELAAQLKSTKAALKAWEEGD